MHVLSKFGSEFETNTLDCLDLARDFVETRSSPGGCRQIKATLAPSFDETFVKKIGTANIGHRLLKILVVLVSEDDWRKSFHVRTARCRGCVCVMQN